MDIRDIELIEAVHRTGSLSKACVELSISQPTLSKRLARLESNLGPSCFFVIRPVWWRPLWLTMCLRNRIKRDLSYAISSVMWS